jgi:hypothetical protein
MLNAIAALISQKSEKIHSFIQKRRLATFRAILALHI